MTTFQDYTASSENYMAAIREDGDLPWFENPERRSRVAAQLGLPQDTDPTELRRVLWARRHKRSNAA